MNNTLIYLIEVTLVFSLLYVVYSLFLSRLTFHRINRNLLLLLIPLSFLLPLINGLFASIPPVIIDVPLYEVIDFNEIKNSSIKDVSIQKSTINYWSVLTIIYCLGVLFSFFKLFITIRKLFILKQKSTTHQKDGFKIVVSNVSDIFSFFNWIFIPKEKHDNYDYTILEHEKVHIKLNHSIDVLLAEIYILFFWYNPLVYFYRKSLKSIHEFQADSEVLNRDIKQSDYLKLLLENLEVNNPNTINSYFNYPILKRRIDMITKVKSTQFRKLQYLILLPIASLFAFSFVKSTTINTPLISSVKIIKTNHLPPSLFPVLNKNKTDITAFFGVNGKHPITKKEKVHQGIDIKAKIGYPVIATADGSISKANIEDGWGNLIVISHNNGYQTWYAHLNDFNVIENQTVKKGDIIGHVGNTGLSTAPHLHYEIRHNGERINPIDFITE